MVVLWFYLGYLLQASGLLRGGGEWSAEVGACLVVSRGVHLQVLMEYQYVHAFSSERHWRCQHRGLRDSAGGAEP